MKKYEILYDWPISEIQRLADSATAETYASGLTPTPLKIFTQLTEQMRGLGADLAAAKAARQHFGKWDELQQCLESFELRFLDFPGTSISKLRLSVLLAEKLADAEPALDAFDIDGNAFEIRNLTLTLPISWFSSENKQSFCDSMAVFSCRNLTGLKTEIATGNLSPLFVFHFLAALHALPAMPVGNAVFVKKTVEPISPAAIDAFAQMVMLATGKCIHSPRRFSRKPSVLDPNVIRPGNVYQQWGEVLTVLSEYNSRDEVLLKYLTIYHVIENLMFKLPIVALERQQNGRMFSIRDFRRLYKKVEMPETDALKQLFAVVFQQQAIGEADFEKHINDRWGILLPSLKETDIDAALAALGVTFTYRGFATQGTAGSFAKLVYVIRNAIVHNKETEFHLTYASMDATVCTIVETFLIPSLEEICFAMIGSPNQYLWYQNKELYLYK